MSLSGKQNIRIETDPASKTFIPEHRRKKFGVMGNRFRKRLKHYDNASYIISAPVNFRKMKSRGMLL
jgi:hypothetical protein